MKSKNQYLISLIGGTAIQTNVLPPAVAIDKLVRFIVDLHNLRYSYDGVVWREIEQAPPPKPQRLPKRMKLPIIPMLLFFALAGSASLTAQTVLPVRAVSFTAPQNNEFFTHPFQWSLAGKPEIMASCESVVGAAIVCNGITVNVRFGTTPYTFMARDVEILYDVEHGEMHYLYTNTDSRMEVTFDRTGIIKYATFAAGEILQRPNLIFVLENIIP